MPSSGRCGRPSGRAIVGWPVCIGGGNRMNRIAVAVLGNDQITREGAVSRLSAYQEVEVLPPDQHKRAEVILILAAQLSDGVLSTMERCGRDNVTTRRPSIVLVANEVRED